MGRPLDEQEKRIMVTGLDLEESAKLQKLGADFCALCGKRIQGTSSRDMPYEISVDRLVNAEGKPYKTYVHSGMCLSVVLNTGRWKDLPDGPLRRIFYKSVEERAKKLVSEKHETTSVQRHTLSQSRAILSGNDKRR